MMAHLNTTVTILGWCVGGRDVGGGEICGLALGDALSPTQAKPDKSDSTLKEDLVTSARAGGRTCQAIGLPGTTGKMPVR
ncbi:hypothetical protein GBF38_010932 [Nibea albiflora]|uniref:Uncharacterized protein n=1 Tax=Nibea albiflora TaxID=240163 RepID=A0ACB7ESK0_NIBAL|nr:hypothetical protein GBF38_010932 [Nibea albiflora]